MANAKPASKVVEVITEDPVVEFIGEGSEGVEYTLDSKALKTRVYNDGFVVIDY